MADRDKIRRMFQGLQAKLQADLNLSQEHDDNTAKGDNSEMSWREMLRRHLPARYKVDAGFVIDSEGNQSDSMDVIIYDGHYSPFVFNENGILYVPAESVYAVAECKQKLSKRHIDYTAQKAASVRELKRTSLPIRQLNGEFVMKDDPGILAGVLTTISDWSPAFGTPFRDSIETAALTSHIDFGCVLQHGSFRIQYAKTTDIRLSSADDALIAFYINLVTDLQALGNVPAIDLKAYYQ